MKIRKKEAWRGEPLADFTDNFCRLLLVATEFCCYNTTATTFFTAFPNYSLSVASPCCAAVGSFTLTPSNSFVQSGGNAALSIINDGATVTHIEGVNLGTTSGFFDGSGTPLLVSPYLSGVVGSNQLGFFGETVLQGELVEAVPLPAALPLFGSALLALAGFAAYRSRRAARG